MKYLASSLALAALMTFATLSDAGAWQRSGSTTLGNGRSFNSQGSGSCSGGTCSGSGSVTGPNGGTLTHKGTVVCYGGVCTSSGSATGPRGGTLNHSGTFSR